MTASAATKSKVATGVPTRSVGRVLRSTPWPAIQLGDVVVSMKNGIYKKREAYADDGVACLRMYNIDAGRIVWRDIKRIRLEADELQEYGLQSGDLLVNRVNSRELVGKTAVIPDGMEQAVFESKNIRVRLDPTKAIPQFVSLQLVLSGSAYFAQNAQQVVGMASISQPQIARFPIVLPPLAEQHQIVAEIEKQFTRLDAGVAALRRVQANLKRYRAAVLKAACEGRLVHTEAELARKERRTFESGEALLGRILTERRRKWQSRGQYKEPQTPETSDLPRLPDGWTWARLEQLGLAFGGLTKNPKRATLPKQFPYLRVANVYANELRLQEIEHIGVENSELEKLLVNAGDLLIVEGNGSKSQIGRLAIWDGSIEPCVHQNHIIKVRLVEPCMPKWVLHWLQSPNGRHFVELVASSTSGLYTLSVNKVGDLPIALPPLAEQKRIAAEVERQLSVIDELDAVASANLQRGVRLRQSILRQSFSE